MDACLIYRRDLFADAGAAPPRTWEEFHALARRFTAPAAKRWGHGIAAFPDGHNTVYDFCLQPLTRGGELFDANHRPHSPRPPRRPRSRFTARSERRGRRSSAVREFDSVKSGLAFARGESR